MSLFSTLDIQIFSLPPSPLLSSPLLFTPIAYSPLIFYLNTFPFLFLSLSPLSPFSPFPSHFRFLLSLFQFHLSPPPSHSPVPLPFLISLPLSPFPSTKPCPLLFPQRPAPSLPHPYNLGPVEGITSYLYEVCL